ncbi:MAG: NAD-binding protein, partial [Chloroflexales bacterium]|nr:NAD-binding protein [Chloroflexales bacterium]
MASRPPRHPIWRLVAANLYDLRLLLRESWVALAGFVALLLIGTIYLFFGYTPAADRPASLAEAAYQTMQLLVLQTSLRYPADPLGAVMFFIMPLLGLALVFQSVLNFGRLLLDKASRREQWQIALASTYRNHVIVCGLGRVGYRAATLLRETGYEVVVIERDAAGEFVEAVRATKVPVVIGDGRLAPLLELAGLSRARGLLAAIGDDLLNIEIALTARRQQPDVNVVLRIFDSDLDSGMERGFGRNSVFSSSAVAAPTLAAAAVSRNLAHVLTHEGSLIGLSELTIETDSALSGFVRTIEELFTVRVLDHVRASGSVTRGERLGKLEGGDRVSLLGTLDALEQARLANRAGSKLGFLASNQLQRPTPRFNTVIVCGLGRVGYRVLNQLVRMPNPPQIVVVTTEAPRLFLEAAERMGVGVVQGDARTPGVLQRAGVDRAYSVVAVTGSDLLNIQIGLAARRARPDIHVVLRVFSDVLAERLAAFFGIHTAYSTSELAAPTLAAGCIISDLSHAIRVGDRLLGQASVTLREGDGVAG